MFHRRQYQVSTRNLNRALYLMISLFSLCFRTNTHLYPTSFTSSGVWTTSPKTSRFVNEFQLCMYNFFPFWPIISMSAFFHISWLGIFIISYDIGGHLESKNIVNNNIISISFFSCVYITYWDLTIFRYMCLFRGFSFNMCLFKSFLFNMCLIRGLLYYLYLF